jgi:hypothetical protein
VSSVLFWSTGVSSFDRHAIFLDFNLDLLLLNFKTTNEKYFLGSFF